ncbi:MAG: fused MFS/spermidine synthase [Deltaproteobacteria bacterium]|nr:fused MFS/spermidine synthase [Deltaproteobacteria bacterium]
MKFNVKRAVFVLFFVSGFCGLLYQVVWLRLAFRHFGIITPVMSVVLSVFMLGLAIGSWSGGRWIATLHKKTGISPISFYAITELLIGVGAVAVPKLFLISESYLLSLGDMNSASYLLVSAMFMMACILPWCVFMGFTFPFMMAYLKSIDASERTSFSFLYLANVIGAMTGTLITAFILIEVLGFKSTLYAAAAANVVVAAVAFTIGRNAPSPYTKAEAEEVPVTAQAQAGEKPALFPLILFITGFISMAIEVVWVRAFTPVLATTVYAFASLLAAYLLATFAGSALYRRHSTQGSVLTNAALFGILAITAFLPIVINDPRINYNPFVLLLSVMPVCAVMGYLTPKLIDAYSNGGAKSAGRAYAVNIAGCIAGPLFASYVLLANFGARLSMVILALPFLILYVAYLRSASIGKTAKAAMLSLSAVLLVVTIFASASYDERSRHVNYTKDAAVLHDYTATVIAHGEGMNKQLLVNGKGMTALVPVTKMLAHWPILLHDGKPESALIICFGMGTTYRSLLSWPVDVTAVELVPSVRDLFWYFHADTETVLKDPRGKIVIDDGRRFLSRTNKKYDIITIDPPPPMTAAGTGFLYSREFFETAKAHLNDDGLLQLWMWPEEADLYTSIAINQSITDAFPYVKLFNAFDMKRGFLYIASMKPINVPTVNEMLKKMPQAAQKDMVEWTPNLSPAQILELTRKNSADAPKTPLTAANNIMLTDDRPANEYFLVRQILGGK